MKTYMFTLYSVLLLSASSMAIAFDCDTPDDTDYEVGVCLNLKNCENYKIRACAYNNKDAAMIIAFQEVHIDPGEAQWVRCRNWAGPCRIKIGKLGHGTSCATASYKGKWSGTDILYKDGKISYETEYLKRDADGQLQLLCLP